jgi:hypothetical protein
MICPLPCVGDGRGGHHPFCEHRPKGIEVRGVVAMNGEGRLCFFADSRAEGVPVPGIDYSPRGPISMDELGRAIVAAPARRVTRDELEALDPPAPVAHDCDVELRGSPNFHPGQCRRDTFQCSCGTQYAHVCDEAEGCWWEAMTP